MRGWLQLTIRTFITFVLRTKRFRDPCVIPICGVDHMRPSLEGTSRFAEDNESVRLLFLRLVGSEMKIVRRSLASDTQWSANCPSFIVAVSQRSSNGVWFLELCSRCIEHVWTVSPGSSDYFFKWVRVIRSWQGKTRMWIGPTMLIPRTCHLCFSCIFKSM